jgi:hypothetical protein
VGRVGRRGLERVDDDRFDDVVADAADGSRTRRVDESIETLLSKAVPPFPDCDGMHADLCRDLAIGAPVGATENDAATKGEGLGRGVPPRPTFEGSAFLVGEGDLNGRSSATRHGSSFLRGSYQAQRLARREIPDSA